MEVTASILRWEFLTSVLAVGKMLTDAEMIQARELSWERQEGVAGAGAEGTKEVDLMEGGAVLPRGGSFYASKQVFQYLTIYLLTPPLCSDCN